MTFESLYNLNILFKVFLCSSSNKLDEYSLILKYFQKLITTAFFNFNNEYFELICQIVGTILVMDWHNKKLFDSIKNKTIVGGFSVILRL